MPGDIIVLIFLAAAVGLSVRSLLKKRKTGGCCGDCSRCSSCGKK